MEKKISDLSLSESEFVNLLHKSRQGDIEATSQILDFFRKDILNLSCYIRMPREDAIQSITLELLQLLKKDDFE